MSVHRQHTFSSPMADSATVSPEPGSFPKRRPAAVSRLAVPNEAGDAQQPCTGGIPSCRSDAAERGSSWPRVPTPPLSAGSHWRAPRLSKPGYQLDPVVYHKVWSIFCLLLLVAVASVSTHRQRQLAAVLSSVQQKHRDDMNLQVAWLAASMTEHGQCKAAVQKADTDYQAAKGGLQKCEAGLQKCETGRSHSSSQSDAAAASSRVAAAALQVQLDASQKHLKEATHRLKKSQAELSTAHQQQQQQQVQLAALQAEKEQWLKDKEQQEKAQSLAAAKQADVGPHATTAPLAPVDLSAPHTAATAAALQAVSAAHHTDGSSSSSGADVPVVLATCSAADLTPDNLITPWCEAVAAAGVPRVLLVSDDAGCAAAAKAAGIKTLHHTFQVPTIAGPLAEQNMRAYRRYAALAQVLSLGHAAVSVEPEVLLLSDPLPLLHQHPTDVTVMSAAAGDERIAYGHVLAPAPDSSSGGDTPAHPAFQVGGLSHALLYLKPQQPALHFVQAMMDGLASGDNAESALLNSLLLAPWHLHSSQQDRNSNEQQLQAAPEEEEPSTHTASSENKRGSKGSAGAGDMPVLSGPVTVGVLPPALFTHSGVVFGASDPTAWLKQRQPVAVHLLPGPSRLAQAQTVLDWLEADIQEVIQMLGHLPEELAAQPASSSSSKQERQTEEAAAASEGPGEVPVQDTPQQQERQQQEQQQSDEQQQQQVNSALPSRQGRRVPADRTRHRRHRAAGGRGSRAQQGARQFVTHRREERKLQEQPAAAAPPSPAAAAVAAMPMAAAPAKQTPPPPPPAAAAKQGPKQQQAAQQAAAVKAEEAAAAHNAATKTAASAAAAAAKVAQQRQQQQGKQEGAEQQAREEQQQTKQQGTREQPQQAQKAAEKKKKHHRKQVH